MHSPHAAVEPSRPIGVVLLATPFALLAYVLFAITMTLIDFVFLPLAPEGFRASLIPHTGWLVSGSYAFTIAFAVALMFQQQRRRLVRFSITLMLLLQIASGIYALREVGRPDFGNPYLTVSPWRPLWTIIVPAVWVLLLHSPGVNRFCRETRQPVGA